MRKKTKRMEREEGRRGGRRREGKRKGGRMKKGEEQGRRGRE